MPKHIEGYFALSRYWNASLLSEVEASLGGDGPVCVLALDENAPKAIWLQGSTDVQMAGCILFANSDAYNAIARQGAAKVEAYCAHTVGATEGLAGSSAKFDCPAPLHGRRAIPDPFANLSPPSAGVCKTIPNSKGNSTTKLAPGTYCNQNFKGKFELEPGNYILRGGEIKLGGNGALTGSGVTLFLMEGAGITFGANENISLTAPTEGDFGGILIYQEKSNTSELKMNGTTDADLTGIIYAPGAHVDMAGNSGANANGNCTRVIADTIRFIGNSNIRTDCEDELAGKEIEIESYVRLAR